MDWNIFSTHLTKYKLQLEFMEYKVLYVLFFGTEVNQRVSKSLIQEHGSIAIIK